MYPCLQSSSLTHAEAILPHSGLEETDHCLRDRSTIWYDFPTMQSHADQELWQREQAVLAGEKARMPELFIPTQKALDELNTRIGILSFPRDLPRGYIKYSPLDFIVEEIRQDGRVITVDGDGGVPLMEGTGTIYADIVKVGISTLDAATRLANALGIEAKQIGHAGIKDAVALT